MHLFFLPIETSSKEPLFQEDKLPVNLVHLMDIAPEHQFILCKGSARIEVELLQRILNQYRLEKRLMESLKPRQKKLCGNIKGTKAWKLMA